MKLISIARRNITRNIRRSILSATAIAVSVLSVLVLFALIEGMTDDMAYNLKTYYTGEIRIRHQDFEQYERYNPIHLTVDWPSIDRALAGNSDIASYTARIPFAASLYLNESNYGVMGVGVDFAREQTIHDLNALIVQGRIPQAGLNEALMGNSLAKDLGLVVGDSVTLLSTTATRGTNAITVKIVGLVRFPVGAMNAKYLWMPLDRVQYFLRTGNGVQEILVSSADSSNTNSLAEHIEHTVREVLSKPVEVKTWRQLNDLYALLEIARFSYYFIGIFFFLLGSTVIINTTMMIIYERMREIGTLAALGMHGKELTRLFFLEGAIISAIGSAVGVAVGVIISLYLNRYGIDFTDALSGIDMEMSSVFYPRINWIATILVYVYAVVISSLATLIPSRRAAKIQPVEALKYV